MPIVSIVTLIRINNAPHVHHVDHFHHVDHAQAEKDAAMKQAESASRAAEMFMKVFIVRYKLSFDLSHAQFARNYSILFLEKLVNRETSLSTTHHHQDGGSGDSAGSGDVGEETYTPCHLKKVLISSFLGLQPVTNSLLPDFS